MTVFVDGRNMTPLPMLLKPTADLLMLEEAPEGGPDREPDSPTTPPPPPSLNKEPKSPGSPMSPGSGRRRQSEWGSNPGSPMSPGRRGSTLGKSPEPMSPKSGGRRGSVMPNKVPAFVFFLFYPNVFHASLSFDLVSLFMRSYARALMVRISATAPLNTPPLSLSLEQKEVLPGGLTPQDLAKPVTLTFTESATQTLLHIPSCRVHTENKDIGAVKKRNAEYEELLASKVTMPR